MANNQLTSDIIAKAAEIYDVLFISPNKKSPVVDFATDLKDAETISIDDVEKQNTAPKTNDLNTNGQDEVLDVSTDPFECRDSKHLTWRNVTMSIKSRKKGSPDLLILDKVWGEVPPGQTRAIMGASGAGKTSLLNVLAGRARRNRSVHITSDVRLNDEIVDPQDITTRRSIAFVSQMDSLQTTSTVREAIYFSAKLRLPRNTSNKQVNLLVDRMISELGLTACADTLIGGVLVKGISGGERKRTAVAVELVVKPSMVFLDEPTSGLDSFSAVQLCKVLKKVARAGSTVLFTIHQPSPDTFESFDGLILISKGRIMYEGPVSKVPTFFSDRGFPCLSGFNTADWIMNVAQSVPVDQLERSGFFPKDAGEEFEAPSDETDHEYLNSSATELVQTPGLLVQIKMLFHRDYLDIRRNTKAVGARFIITAFLGLLIGMIFFKVGISDQTVGINSQSRFGALTMILITSMFGTAQPPLIAFPEERPVFLREYSTNHYSVFGYFLSRLVNELVLTGIQVLLLCVLTHFMVKLQGSFSIFFLDNYAMGMSTTALAVLLGSCFEDAKSAAEMVPTILVPQILFSGFFVAPSLIPVFLRWLQHVCTLTYAVRIAVVNEFYNCNPDHPAENAECNRIVEGTNSNPNDTWWYWLMLVAFFLVFRTLALIVLRRRATF